MTNSKYNRWKFRFELWKKSSKSRRAWSLEAGLPYERVLYWFKKFTEEKPVVKFIEVKETEKITSGVTIKFEQWTISLEKNFDRSTLIQCLQAFGAKSC